MSNREAISQTVTAWKMGYEAAKAEMAQQAEPSKWRDMVVVSLVREGLAQIESDEFWQTGNHTAIAMAVEAKLKEKNT